MARNVKSKALSRKKGNEKLESIAELEARLSPEAKAKLAKIDEIRRSIGPVPFKVMDLIREIRDHEKKIKPESRKMLEEIREIRDAIGPVKTDSGELLYHLSEKDG